MLLIKIVGKRFVCAQLFQLPNLLGLGLNDMPEKNNGLGINNSIHDYDNHKHRSFIQNC